MGLKKGTRLQDRFVITEIIARGGMGEVYKAIDERFTSEPITVAIKETYFDDKESRRQFELEATILRLLHHGNLPKVYDHFSEADSHFLVMDYIEGDDLLSLLKSRNRPFPPEQVKDWAEILLKTLQYLQSRSPAVIHRDIKPQNIKLTAEGQLYLLDFGLAKQSATVNRAGGSMRGYTLGYAPPEQIAGKRTDERSDLYSLGATLYHLLTGAEPAPAIIREQGIHKIGFDPLKNEIERLPAPFAKIIGRAMEIEPDARYRNATEMLESLKEEKKERSREETKREEREKGSRDNAKKGPESIVAEQTTPRKGELRTRVLPIAGVMVLVAAIVTGIIYSSKSGIAPQDQPGGAITLANGRTLRLEMVDLPGGEYQMGGNQNDDEKPVHRVRVRPFSIGKYEVTQEEWEAVMGNNPSNYKGEKRPVENVTWNDVQEFLRKIGNGYRLPTEAEWEYAARGGTTTNWSFGDDTSKLGEYAWFDGNAGGETHQVGQKKPNGFGLYDMHGNVWEWVEDPWHDSYVGAPEDGRAWISGGEAAHRVFRGGSWRNSSAVSCRSACRDWDTPGGRGGNLGFRLSRTLP